MSHDAVQTMFLNALDLKLGSDLPVPSFVWQHYFIKLIFKGPTKCQALGIERACRQDQTQVPWLLVLCYPVGMLELITAINSFFFFLVNLFLLGYGGWVAKYLHGLCPIREMSILISLE